MIKKMEQGYKDFVTKHGSFVHYKVDTDEHPRIKYFYDVRYEPFFQFKLNGMNIKRVIGFNFEHLDKIVAQIQENHLNDFEYIGDSKNKYVDYYKENLYFEKRMDRQRDLHRAGLIDENE